MSKTYINHLWV